MSHQLTGIVKDVAKELVHAPWSGNYACPVCHSWRYAEEVMCNNCRQAIESLSHPCREVFPITLYRRPSRVRDWLKFYKACPEGFIPEYGKYISAILSAAYSLSGRLLHAETGGWDRLAVVPSTTRSSDSHPLEPVLRNADLPFEVERPLIRTPEPLGHRVMSDHAFEARKGARGKRYLLVDDVYTTGARSQSASSALQIGGAEVVGVLVVGRRINPDFCEPARLIWAQQKARPFRFEELFRDSEVAR